MTRFVALVALFAPLAGALKSEHRTDTHVGAGVVNDFPFYHTTEQLTEEIQKLAQECPHIQYSQRTADDGSVTLDLVHLKKQGATPRNRAMLLFGEHARELISPESALHFMKTACGKTDVDPKDLLDHSEFTIVPNGNPKSRKKVEEGQYCLRVNENGVDLNRNWDSHWEADKSMGPDTNPGDKPWSEAETRIFKNVAQSVDDMTLFLTVHSGTKGMYAPWAFDMEHLAKGSDEMIRVLNMVDKDHCQCPFGAAGREVGYSCPGTCLDWVYQNLDTPYSYAFEIYTNPIMNDDLKERWQEKVNELRQRGNLTEDGSLVQVLSQTHLAHDDFKDLFEAHPSGFVQLSSQQKLHLHSHTRSKSAMDCFTQFNPGNEGEFTDVLNNWSQAYIDMSNEIARKLSSA